jgi:predicted nucleic acid-binding protein
MLSPPSGVCVMSGKYQSPIMVYADTSVYDGVYDDEFSIASTRFFDAVRRGSFQLVLSEIVHRELSFAPTQVQNLFKEMLPLALLTPVTDEAIKLQQAYIREGIVTKKSLDDALHVALATVSGCDLIVSWNFKHIVHFQKIPLFNAVNILNGYNSLMIYSPLEVIENEDQEF